MSDLFRGELLVPMTDYERERFRSITVKDESGGPQALYRELEELGAGRAEALLLDDGLAHKVYRYAYSYSSGGYQHAFRPIARALARAGWEPGEHHQAPTRPSARGKAWDGGGA